MIGQNDACAISVIIPFYNVEKWLGECLDSLDKQSFKDFETILINDASTDGSREIAENYSKKHENVIIINKDKSTGPSDSRNLGIEKSSGKFIFMLDSDDYLKENAFERLYSLATTNELDMIVFDIASFKDNNSVCSEYNDIILPLEPNVIKTGCEIWDDMLAGGYFPCEVWRKFVKRSTLQKSKLRFISGIIHEDHPFCVEELLVSSKVMYLNEALYFHRERVNSIMTATRNADRVVGYITGLLDIENFVLAGNYESKNKKIHYDCLADNIWIYFRRCTKKERIELTDLLIKFAAFLRRNKNYCHIFMRMFAYAPRICMRILK